MSALNDWQKEHEKVRIIRGSLRLFNVQCIAGITFSIKHLGFGGVHLRPKSSGNDYSQC